jgi:hypothetical protein
MGHGRVLFLDFDGVLVHEGYAGEQGGEELWSECDIDPEAVALLDALCARAGADVVISSTWRRTFSLDELRGMLERRGFRGAVVGVTPSLYRSPEGARLERGDEIQAWLDEHPEVGAFAILDDDADMAHLRPFLVRTSMASGLRPQHLEPALAAFEASAASSRKGATHT